jgi:hypothetical protein
MFKSKKKEIIKMEYLLWLHHWASAVSTGKDISYHADKMMELHNKINDMKARRFPWVFQH